MRQITVCIMLTFLFASNLFGGEITLRMKSPQNGQRVDTCSDIEVQAEVTVLSGEVKRIYYYKNGRSIGSERNEPYIELLEEVKPGIHDISAKAVDTDNNEFFSDTVQIIVDPVVDGNKLINGEFACGSISPWQFSLNSGAQATITVEEDGWLSEHDPFAFVEITSNPGEKRWHVSLSQSCPIESGHTYEIWFAADSDNPKSIGLVIQENGGNYEVRWSRDVVLDYSLNYGPFVYECNVDDPTAEFKVHFASNMFPVWVDAIEVIDTGWEPRETGVKKETYHHPGDYELKQNFPNPFNPTTTISYTIPTRFNVELVVYDIFGKKVATLVDEEKESGSYVAHFAASELPSGPYLYRLTTGTQTITRKMLFLK